MSNTNSIDGVLTERLSAGSPAILSKLLWNSIVAHMLSFIFSLNTWRLSIIKIRKIKLMDGRMTIQELSTAMWESEREWVVNTWSLFDSNINFRHSNQNFGIHMYKKDLQIWNESGPSLFSFSHWAYLQDSGSLTIRWK